MSNNSAAIAWRARPAVKHITVWIDRHPLYGLTLVVLIAAVLGAANLWLHPPDVAFSQINLWWQIAQNLSHGYGYVGCAPAYFPFCGPHNQITAAREPVPVLLFAGLGWLTNQSLFAASLVMLLTNLAVIVATYYLARELADTRTALLAALLWACYLPAVRLFYAEASGDLLATLAVTLSIRHFLRARKTDKRHDWLAAGVWLGIGILSRSGVAAIGPVLAIAYILQPNARRQPALRLVASQASRLGLFALALALVLGPWTVRNYIVFGQPVVGSTLNGYNLYRANYLLPTENFLHFVGSNEAGRARDELIERRRDLRGSENELEMDSVYRAEAMRIIAAEPARYVASSAYRFLMLWFDWTVPEAYGISRSVFDYLMLVQQGLLLGVSLVGVCSRWRQVWPLAIGILAVNVTYMAVIARIRYIVPVMPLVVVVCAITCIQVGSQLFQESRKSQSVT